MLRFVIFIMAAAIGAASFWASRRVRASEDDLLPWVSPTGRSASSSSSASSETSETAAPVGGSGWRVSQASNAQRMGADGQWVDVAADTALAAGDQLRTKADGKLMLRDEPGATVFLSGVGHLTIQAGSGAAKVLCSEGFITAAAAQDEVAVAFRQADAVASSAAAYSAFCSAARTIIHASDGEVKIAQGGSTKDVDKGQLAFLPNSGDVTTQKLGAEVELKLEPAQVQKEVVVIAGHVAPGTRVLVGTMHAAVDEAGHFQVKAPLPSGDSIAVQATDIAGRERTTPVAVAQAKKGKPPPPKKGKK